MAAIRRKTNFELGYHLVDKYTIIRRLEESGRFEIAISALKSNELLYHKWLAVKEIKSNDEKARKLFEDIGLDPEVILAK